MDQLSVYDLRKKYSDVSWKALLQVMEIPIAKERSTGTLYILSPFSGEKTASCQLVEKNGRFHDYSTGELGNKVQFVLWIQNHAKDITAESLETTEKVFKEAQNLTL